MATTRDMADTQQKSDVPDYIIEEHKKYFTFFNLSIALIAITGIELVIIYVPINKWFVFSSLVVLSTVKFLGVIWWFMHLRWDRALCTIVFLIGLILATGTVTALMLLFSRDPDGPPEIMTLLPPFLW
ncbi:MAG: cytochrome C oxidase subunit IV family protein [Opitutales bacterium]|nr:cytochrome C oxidase subunit IV family protein [Opitutales bacterium]